ncbi:GrpB family protein [Occultella kanbiaonis]|uniref:GrpB family protein n=1 Tax=Occultella kanbiaonis TaxID=2675754 RepID=UPI001A98098A|nr:GrpB family protein [Occultella kanbiaonis]
MERDAIEWFDRPGGEPAVIVAPSTQWATEATRWLNRIRAAIGDPNVRLEHIGSTAVPGLPAKPVLDVQVSVPNLADEARYRPALESLGLILRVREPGHRFFRPPAGEPRTVHVHVCEIGSVWESDQLRFRDALRASPETARSYADLKQHLAEALGHDREAYTRGKSDFIRSVLAAQIPPA